MNMNQCRDPLSAPAPERGDVMYGDSDCPGLFLRVTSAGNRSWYLYKYVGGKPLKFRIGDCRLMSVAEARIEAIVLLRELVKGRHPAQRRQQQQSWEWTIDKLFARYFKEHVRQRSSRPTEIARAFDLYWQPIKTFSVLGLSTADIQTWMNKLAETSGKATANKQFTILRACIRWGQKQQLYILQADPCLSVKLFKLEPRERFLRPGDEALKLCKALQNNPGDFADAIWLLLWTSARKRSVLSMKWSELDLPQKTWRFIGKGKKKLCHKLTDYALEVIERRRFRCGDSPWVFPADSKSGHIENIDYFWRKSRAKIGLNDLHLHDLRHTGATWLSAVGASAFVIQKALQHSNISTSAHYTHAQMDDVLTAMNRAQRMGLGA